MLFEANKALTFHCGEVAEWSIATVLKTVGGASPPGVRIPPSPPFLKTEGYFPWQRFAGSFHKSSMEMMKGHTARIIGAP